MTNATMEREAGAQDACAIEEARQKAKVGIAEDNDCFCLAHVRDGLTSRAQGSALEID